MIATINQHCTFPPVSNENIAVTKDASKLYSVAMGIKQTHE